MAYATPEEISKAKEMDLLTYLQNYEPQELVKISSGNYCTREHDSLKISNGKWYWFSRKIGSTTALDYLIHVKGYSLPAAVEAILGRSLAQPPVPFKQLDRSSKALLLPEKHRNNLRVTSYLRSRGIHPVIIDYCYRQNLLYEGLPYHNAVFIGRDEQGVPRYAALRGTTGLYKGEASGSSKRYSFHIPATENAATVHVFESAIDLLSYATMEYQAGRPWQTDHLLSLAGVFQTKRADVIPVALQRYLSLYPKIQTIQLHLDNDPVGRGASRGIITGLHDRYHVIDSPPSFGKDVNDELMYHLTKTKKRDDVER